MAKVAVVYYSSTGNTYELAKAIAAGAEFAGAQVRLRRVKELAPKDAIASNPAWGAHLAATANIDEVSLDDLDWAEAYAFGAPTRFGVPASQLRSFIDTTGGLWFAGKLANKAATAFTGASTVHGGHETTLQSLYTTFMHWGDIIVPPGYTAPVLFETGNPYGSSFVDPRGQGSLSESTLAAARWQGERLARVAAAISAAAATIAAPPSA